MWDWNWWSAAFGSRSNAADQPAAIEGEVQISLITKNHIEKAKEIAQACGASRIILFDRGQINPEAARDLGLARP